MPGRSHHHRWRRNGESLDRLNPLDTEDAIVVLRGRASDERGRRLINIGDTVAVSKLRLDGLRAEDGLELLIVKRIDRRIKVSDYVLDVLKEHGVREVFLVPGEANAHLLDSVGRSEGVNCRLRGPCQACRSLCATHLYGYRIDHRVS